MNCPFCGSEVETISHISFMCTNLGDDDQEACGALVDFPHVSVTSHAKRLFGKRVENDIIDRCVNMLITSYPEHAWLNAACAALRSMKKR